MSDDNVLTTELPGAPTQPRILPRRTTDFLRTKPRPPRSLRGLNHEWLVIPGVGYRLDIPDICVTFDVARVRTKFDEVWGLLTVRAQFTGAKTVADNILSSADFSFSNARSRRERARDLEKRSCAPEIDFDGLIEELCLRVLEHAERGDPEITLADVSLPEKEYQPIVIAAMMPLLKQHPVIWFGDGGAAKSLLALYAALDLAENGWNVLYCDWELSPEEHAHRMRQLLGPSAILPRSLFYRRCNRPFVDDILPIREIIAKRRISFLVCDSLSFGAKAPIESSESALGYQQALRECGPIGSLHLAHTNRSAVDSEKKPFGSTYWHNMARATWFLKRGDDSPLPTEITIGCYHKKANLGPLVAPIAHRIAFSREHIDVSPGFISDDQGLVEKLHIKDKITLALRNGPMSEALIASECGEKADSVTRTIRRYKTLFDRVLGHDGISRVSLVKTA